MTGTGSTPIGRACHPTPGGPTVDVMDTRDEIRDFLSSRRATITPEQAGLPAYGGAQRRVPGLRREEVAMLAGVSNDYYVRLERGNLAGVSDEVLEALATALQLTEAERAHLHDLACTAANRPARTRSQCAFTRRDGPMGSPWNRYTQKERKTTRADIPMRKRSS